MAQFGGIFHISADLSQKRAHIPRMRYRRRSEVRSDFRRGPRKSFGSPVPRAAPAGRAIFGRIFRILENLRQHGHSRRGSVGGESRGPADIPDRFPQNPADMSLIPGHP